MFICLPIFCVPVLMFIYLYVAYSFIIYNFAPAMNVAHDAEHGIKN